MITFGGTEFTRLVVNAAQERVGLAKIFFFFFAVLQRNDVDRASK